VGELPIQGQNDRFVPCQLGGLNLQPSSYKTNALTTRLPCHPIINGGYDYPGGTNLIAAFTFLLNFRCHAI
jgi:hypothetical protein